MPFFPEQLGFPRVDIWNSEEKRAIQPSKDVFTLESLGEIRQCTSAECIVTRSILAWNSESSSFGSEYTGNLSRLDRLAA